MLKGVFVSGIGTAVGKTVVSAILTRALQADYWKPIQSGDLDGSDRMTVQELSQVSRSCFHPEAYQLQTPASPHYAAELDQVQIELPSFTLPKTDNFLIVEGAGGLMVPLNEQHTMLDLIRQLQLPVVLVSRHYLGSINHSLLSLACLQERRIPLAGLIFNGPSTPSSTSIIEKMSGQKALFHLPEHKAIDEQQIDEWATQWRPVLEQNWLS